MRPQASIFTPILIAASLILFLSFVIRSSFGVFQIPIAADLGWFRSEFSLALAIQNLAWGLGTPIFGAIAERFGDKRAILLGTLLYSAGLCLSAFAISPFQHQWLEIFVGLGIAGTGFGVVLGVVGRSAAPEQRSLALGLTTAAGSMGQVFGPPFAQYLLNWMHWSSVFLVFSGMILLCLICLPFLRSDYKASKEELEETLSSIISRALRDPSYIMIFIGFFSCGFQLGFMTAHFPAFVTEICASIDANGLLAKFGITTTAALGAVALGVIGVFNIFGTISAGVLGNRFQKISFSIHICRTNSNLSMVYSCAYDTFFSFGVLCCHGLSLACNCATNIWLSRLSIWPAVHGHAVWARIFFTSVGFFSWRLAWWVYV